MPSPRQPPVRVQRLDGDHQIHWPAPATRRALRKRLLAWFARRARDLPWRRTRDPYAIWVSEIMLQQTQVATVVDYYNRFMRSLPSVQALAAADEQQVLRLWEGLGYYRRARHLHRAAQVIVAEHGGRFPRDPALVRGLPGIGRYTAGAITSIAFDAREPILEANTFRLLSRLLAFRGDPRQAAGQQLLWRLAEELLPAANAGAFNQALMELGSQVCSPRAPRCEACPWSSLCPTRRLGLQDQIPALRAKPATESVREAAVIVRRNGRVLVMQCGQQGRWAGLWDFPRFSLGERDPSESVESRSTYLSAEVLRLTGVESRIAAPLTTLTHGVTRFRITLECHLADFIHQRRRRSPPLKWLSPTEITGYPLNTTGRKLSRLLAGLEEAE